MCIQLFTFVVVLAFDFFQRGGGGGTILVYKEKMFSELLILKIV